MHPGRGPGSAAPQGAFGVTVRSAPTLIESTSRSPDRTMPPGQTTDRTTSPCRIAPAPITLDPPEAARLAARYSPGVPQSKNGREVVTRSSWPAAVRGRHDTSYRPDGIGSRAATADQGIRAAPA